jgi:solute carrier family 25 citrate transporter 1
MSHQHRDPLRGILSGICFSLNCLGGITGAIEICITYPTEYVKTMM